MERAEEKPSFESFHQTVDTAISEGRQLQVAFGLPEAEAHFTNLLSELNSAEIQVLTERGLVYRMRLNYTFAENDFSKALELSRQINNLDGEATALGGLIDIARTGERDPNYQRGKDLNQAEAWKIEAQKTLAKMPENPPRLSRVNTLIQFGLLEHELIQDLQALESYNQAERECRGLIIQNPDDSNFKNRLMRILTVRGVVQMVLGHYDDASTDQKESLIHYAELGDVRGQGNAALSLGQLAEKVNNPKEAIVWYQKTLEISQRVEDGEVKIIDREINRLAIEALNKLSLPKQ